MSWSKVYKDAASFVPEQILPRQDLPTEPIWQDMVEVPPSRRDGHDLFVPDTNAGGRNIPDQTPTNRSLPAKGPSSQTTAPSPDLAPKIEADPEKIPAPAIDLELLHKKAFSEGVLVGRRQADEDYGASAKTLLGACEQLTHLHETILKNNTSEIHALVMAIAEKIIRKSIEEQSETILATIKDAIHLAVKSDEFQIRVNPSDLEILKDKKKEILDEISSLDNIIIKADSTIERGGCLLESASCTVDATIASQLQVIKEALQSDDIDATSFPGEP